METRRKSKEQDSSKKLSKAMKTVESLKSEVKELKRASKELSKAKRIIESLKNEVKELKKERKELNYIIKDTREVLSDVYGDYIKASEKAHNLEHLSSALIDSYKMRLKADGVA